MITIPQRHRQTDRQTTCLGSTPLRVASRGKNSVNPNIFNALKLCIQQCAWRSLWRSYNKLENHTLSANLCQSAILTFNYVTIRFSTCHFLLVVHWNRVSISINFFQDICIQVHLRHDLELLTIWYPRFHFYRRSIITAVFEIFGPTDINERNE